MKAIIQRTYGNADSLELRDVDPPRAGDNEVVVRVAAAGVDRGALHLMTGKPYLMRLLGFGLRRPSSAVPGTNVAGRVESVGTQVTRFVPGDEVYGTCAGSFAELARAPEDRLAPKPPTLTFAEAASLPYAGTVALQAVREHAQVRAGQSVLIVGASGAVGSVAVQIAKAAGGEVTGVCSTSNIDFVRRLGADHVIDYTEVDFATRASLHDAIIDIGGNSSVARLRRVLSHDGTATIVGGEGGGRWIGGVHRQLWALVLSRFVRQRLGTLIAREDASHLLELNELVAAGNVRPVIARTYPLADAAQAARDLEAGRLQGRLVVLPGGDGSAATTGSHQQPP